MRLTWPLKSRGVIAAHAASDKTRAVSYFSRNFRGGKFGRERLEGEHSRSQVGWDAEMFGWEWIPLTLHALPARRGAFGRARHRMRRDCGSRGLSQGPKPRLRVRSQAGHSARAWAGPTATAGSRRGQPPATRGRGGPSDSQRCTGHRGSLWRRLKLTGRLLGNVCRAVS